MGRQIYDVSTTVFFSRCMIAYFVLINLKSNVIQKTNLSVVPGSIFVFFLGTCIRFII